MITNSIADIAAGKIGAAAKYITDSLIRTVPIVLSFLSHLLNLNKITETVRKAIDKVREPIEKAIRKGVKWLVDTVKEWLKKAKKYIKKRNRKPAKVAETSAKDKAAHSEKATNENGVEKDENKASDKASNWINMRETFEDETGHVHTLFFKGNEENAQLMVASVPKKVNDFIKEVMGELSNDEKKEVQDEVQEINKSETTIEKNVRKLKKELSDKEEDKSERIITQEVKTIQQQFVEFFSDAKNLSEYPVEVQQLLLSLDGKTKAAIKKELKESKKEPIEIQNNAGEGNNVTKNKASIYIQNHVGSGDNIIDNNTDAIFVQQNHKGSGDNVANGKKTVQQNHSGSGDNVAGKKILSDNSNNKKGNEWWNEDEEFKLSNGEEHELYFKGKGLSAVLYMASKNPESIKDKLGAIPKDKIKNQKKLNELYIDIDAMYSFIKNHEKQTKGKDKETFSIADAIDDYLKDLRIKIQAAVEGIDDLPMTKVTYKMEGGKAKEVIANPLTKISGNTKGESTKNNKKVAANPLGWNITHYINKHKRELQRQEKADPNFTSDVKSIDIEKWNKTHLLAGELHGPVEKWNLAPTSSSVNNTLISKEQEALKYISKVDKPNVYKLYKVTVEYQNSDKEMELNGIKWNIKDFPTAVKLEIQREDDKTPVVFQIGNNLKPPTVENIFKKNTSFEDREKNKIDNYFKKREQDLARGAIVEELQTWNVFAEKKLNFKGLPPNVRAVCKKYYENLSFSYKSTKEDEDGLSLFKYYINEYVRRQEKVPLPNWEKCYGALKNKIKKEGVNDFDVGRKKYWIRTLKEYYISLIADEDIILPIKKQIIQCINNYSDNQKLLSWDIIEKQLSIQENKVFKDIEYKRTKELINQLKTYFEIKVSDKKLSQPFKDAIIIYMNDRLKNSSIKSIPSWATYKKRYRLDDKLNDIDNAHIKLRVITDLKEFYGKERKKILEKMEK